MLFVLLATVIIGGLLYKLLFSKSKSFWKEYGIREIDTSPVIGKLDIFFGRKPLTDADDYAYNQLGSSEKFCGLMELGKPAILVKDIELMKKVLIKDFDHFIDRRQIFSHEDGLLTSMLTNMMGDEWKGVRASVSPTFTTGKIRRMMDSFNKVGKEWGEEFTRKAKSTSSGSVTIDVMTCINQYTVEVICTAVFGISAGAIKNPDSTFIKMANRVSDFTKYLIMKLTLRIYAPWLSRLLGMSIIDRTALSFFEKILEQGLQSRLRGDTKGNDFLQLLVEAKKGELKATGADELDIFEKDAQILADTSKKQYLTEKIMTAQSVLFFFAGFTTTSNFLTFALYALAVHSSVQDKLRKEVGKIVKKDGSLDYDDVNQLVYLDMVVCEILRLFPAALRLERMCVKEYRDPEIGLVIPKGTTVSIPVNSIHHSKEYYDTPDVFDPEHFSPEKKKARNPYGFIPFGIGPRNCIGMRFALTEVKSAMAHIVHNFIIDSTRKTPIPMKGISAGFQLVPPPNLELKLTPISKQ